MRIIILFSLTLTLILFSTCKKENTEMEEEEIIVKDTILTPKYFTNLEKLKLTYASIFAYKMAKSKSFKKNILDKLIDEDGKMKHDLLLLDIIDDLERDQFGLLENSEKLNIEQNDFESFRHLLQTEYPTLVFKIPHWVEFLQYGRKELENEDFRVIPLFQINGARSVYTLNYENKRNSLNIEEKEIGKEAYTYIPILLRISEYHELVNPTTLLKYEDNESIVNGIMPNFELSDDCHPRNLMKDVFLNYELGGRLSDYKIIDNFDWKEKYEERKCKEICGNNLDDDGDGDIDEFCGGEKCYDGIDNDHDGLIDCLDPDCQCDPLLVNEICDNGIDDDGDGLIDQADGDCCEYWVNYYDQKAPYLRDCVEDENYLVGVQFSRVGKAQKLNEAMEFNDWGDLNVIFYPFKGGTLNPVKISTGAYFLTDFVSNPVINPESQAFFICSYTDAPHIRNYTGISYKKGSTTWYLNIDATGFVNPSTSSWEDEDTPLGVMWNADWNGNTVGENVTLRIFYHERKLLNESGNEGQSTSGSLSNSATQGISIGGAVTVGTGGANVSASVGYTWNQSASNTQSQTMSGSTKWSYSYKVEDCGTPVPLLYKDGNGGGFSPILTAHPSFVGQSQETGAVVIYTKIVTPQ